MVARFQLSQQLQGHTGDVRSLSALHLGDPLKPLLLSASRDGTGRIWARPDNSKAKRDIEARINLEGHAGFVNASAWLNTGSQAYALTGGQDHLVNAFTLPLQSLDPAANSSLTPDFVLVGHEDNVCALDALSGPRGYVVSGSWDKTARVWKEWNCVSVLGDHAQAVWAVKAIDEDLVLTASADKVVRMFSLAHSRKDGEVLLPVAKFVGHTDAVRGLTMLSARAFASCGNDGNIHIYNLPNVQGPSPVQAVVQPSQVLSGHTSFVYALDSLSSGEIVSSGEDRSARVWKDGALQQTITIPAISVWSIACLSNGDIACASSDNFIRIFTREPQRMADVQELQAYETTVSSQALNKAQVGDVQKDSLPAPDALLQPGRKEGEVRMVRNGELVEAHQWSSAANQWEKIGEVVGGVGSGQKKLYQGKEYDYVFDVDIADGIPPLKLPYNATENPYNAAYKFLERNELPLTYVDQVVAFIEKNTEAVNLGSNNEFVDPYTGASSYRPGASSASAPAAAAPRPSAPVAPPILPLAQPLTFKQFNETGAKSKIDELNGQLSGATALTTDEKDAISALLSSLTKLSSQQATGQPQLHVTPLETAMARWPLALRFPLLDAFRAASAYPTTTPADECAKASLRVAAWTDSWPTDAEQDKTKSILAMLALRAVANAFSRKEEASSLLESGSLIAVELRKSGHFGKLNKNARTAYATVAFNFSVLVVSESSSVKLAASTLDLVIGILKAENDPKRRDGEVLYRALVALGNLLVSKSAGSLSVGSIADAVGASQAAVSSEERIRNIQREIAEKDTAVRGI